MFSIINEPSALLSNARSTIATLIQRPSSINTSNAFEEFSILDHLIDVSKDVDRFEDIENRKFVNIAQVITASTCIYSRRVDALYKLINNFNDNPTEENSSSDESEKSTSIEIVTNTVEHDDEPKKTKKLSTKEKSSKRRRSFISLDPDKLNYNNTSKAFFLDRTSLVDIKLFQKYVPTGNKQFWFDDYRPMIFDLLFDDQQDQNDVDVPVKSERLIDVINQVAQMDQEIPLPDMIDDRIDLDEDRENLPPLVAPQGKTITIVNEKKKNVNTNKSRTKKVQNNEIDLNIFRRGLSNDEQALFYCQKLKPLGTNKVNSIESKDFFTKPFERKHFDALIKDCPSSILPLFIYPTITIQYQTIRERYSTKSVPSVAVASKRSRSPPVPLNEAIDHDQFLPFSSSSPIPFVEEEDADLRLRTDMEQFLGTALDPTHDEQQQHNRVFLLLRSSITNYVNEHENEEKINAEDLILSLSSEYSLALVFSQLLQFCATTQRYSLQSDPSDSLYLEKLSVR